MLQEGECIIPISQKGPPVPKVFDPDNLPNKDSGLFRQVRFQLAEVAQSKNGFCAGWFTGFWLVDDNLYLEDGKIYLKDEEKKSGTY